MAISTDMGLALLQGGAVLTGGVVIRGCCARQLTTQMVPTVLRGRVQLCNRLAPIMLLIGATMLVVGALLWLTSR